MLSVYIVLIPKRKNALSLKPNGKTKQNKIEPSENLRVHSFGKPAFTVILRARPRAVAAGTDVGPVIQKLQPNCKERADKD